MDIDVEIASMRPNIHISHALNGRVKDLAESRDENVEETYRVVIEAGLESLEDE